jgi:uncharacterized membrane protein
MTRPRTAICQLLMLALIPLSACSREPVPSAVNEGAAETAEAGLWDMQSSGEGSALVITDSAGKTALRLFCAAGRGSLMVNVPSFTPVGSEERLSFGQGGEVVALVADPSGDELRGGVTGEGPVPASLMQLLSGQPSASYGAQVSGPHPAPPGPMVRDFVAACSDGPSREGSDDKPLPAPGDQPATTPASSSPCLIQDGKPIPANAIRAIGTEPFWGARVEGRCVTYSHPDDQAGTRVWTKFTGSAANGVWTGSLRGQPFVMRTRAEPGCSDGMSDRRYPIAVSLTVGGEQRSGCAEPR